MVTTVQIAGLSITAVLIAKLLERYAAEQAMMLTLLLGAALTALAVYSLSPILNETDTLLASSGLSTEHTAAVSKAIGICIVTQLAADVCKDAGESALCTAVTLTGKAALILLSLPLFSSLLQLLREVLSCVSY